VENAIKLVKRNNLLTKSHIKTKLKLQQSKSPYLSNTMQLPVVYLDREDERVKIQKSIQEDSDEGGESDKTEDTSTNQIFSPPESRHQAKRITQTQRLNMVFPNRDIANEFRKTKLELKKDKATPADKLKHNIINLEGLDQDEEIMTGEKALNNYALTWKFKDRLNEICDYEGK
jgi:hypothetical protein